VLTEAERLNGRSFDMVSLSQEQTNSPVTIMMISRSRLGIRVYAALSY
jgi:hypothetical protein